MEDDGGVGCSRVHSCCPSSLVLSSQSRPDSAVLTQVASVSGWRALATPSAASPRLTEHRHVGCCTTCHPGSKESSSLCPESKKHPTQDLHPPPRDRYCNLSSEIQFRGVRGEKTVKSHLMPPPHPPLSCSSARNYSGQKKFLPVRCKLSSPFPYLIFLCLFTRTKYKIILRFVSFALILKNHVLRGGGLLYNLPAYPQSSQAFNARSYKGT